MNPVKNRNSIFRTPPTGVIYCFGLFFTALAFGETLDFGSNTPEVLCGRAWFVSALKNLLKNAGCHALAWTSLAFLMGRGARFILIPAIVWIAGTETVAMGLARVFNDSMASEWLALLRGTNTAETVGFFKTALTLFNCTALVAFLAFSTIAGRILWKARYPRPSLRSCTISIVLIGQLFIVNAFATRWNYGIGMTYLSFAAGGVNSMAREADLKYLCKSKCLPEHLSVAVPEDKLPVAVYVIGESSTRRNWHLYGYPRQTTPRMDAFFNEGALAVFTDIVSISPATHHSLEIILTTRKHGNVSRDGWTLPGAFAHAGYATCHISNQTAIFSDKYLVSLVFNGAQTRIGLSETAKHATYHGYVDSGIAPVLSEFLAAHTNSPAAVFIHMTGMHYPCDKSHPGSFNRFGPADMPQSIASLPKNAQDRCNRFDNATLFQDANLGAIVDALSKTGRPAFMFYISDHGESPWTSSPAGWRDYQDMGTYEVPCIIWASPEYRSIHENEWKRILAAQHKPAQNDELTPALLDLGFILLPKPLPESENFLSPKFKGRSPRLVNLGRMVYEGNKSP